MAIEIKQNYRGDISATRNGATQKAGYVIRKKNDQTNQSEELSHDEAYREFFAYITSNFPYVQIPGFQRQLKLETINVPLKQETYPIYHGETTWAFNVKQPRVGEPPLWSFSFQAGSTRLTYPLAEQQWIRREGDEHPVIKFAGINWNKDGYDGVEVKAPDFKISVKMVVPNNMMSPWYVAMLGSLVPSVNNAYFHGFAANTLLYNGATIDEQADQEYGTLWNINHSFDFADNLTNYNMNGFKIPFKRAHDYAWMSFVEKIDSEDRTVSVADQLNIAPIYRHMDFTYLGIY